MLVTKLCVHIGRVFLPPPWPSPETLCARFQGREALYCPGGSRIRLETYRAESVIRRSPFAEPDGLPLSCAQG